MKRSFLFLLIASVVLLTLTDCTNQSKTENDSPGINDIGIIMNTVGDEMNNDYVATLTSLSEMGYKYIEGGYYGDSVVEYVSLLTKLGLKSIAYGGGLEQLMDNPDEVISVAKALEAPFVVCYFPWTYNWETRNDEITLEGALLAAGQLNAIGAVVKEAGLQFVWHNHDLELITLENGASAFDVIMDNTDADLVYAEMDVYWTTKGGGDPVKQLQKYQNRIPLLHMKDMDNTEEKSFACVGEGIIDFEAVLKVAKESGVQHCIVEHDDPADGIHCAQIGYTTIHSILTKLQ